MVKAQNREGLATHSIPSGDVVVAEEGFTTPPESCPACPSDADSSAVRAVAMYKIWDEFGLDMITGRFRKSSGDNLP